MPFEIKTALGGTYPIQATLAKPDYLINYTLIEGSNGKYKSIDRGQQTDRYTTTFSFGGTADYINQLTGELTLLRASKLPVTITGIPEPIFGDLIDHTEASNPNGIVAYVLDFNKQMTPTFNVQKIDVSFITDTEDLIFNTDASLPDLCMRPKYEGYRVWNTNINESYNRDIFFVDRVADTYVFKGNYILSDEDNSRLLNWWRGIRGSEFIANDNFWANGLKMFGGSVTGTNHPAVIKSITYTQMSPKLRDVTVEIYRNGNYD